MKKILSVIFLSVAFIAANAQLKDVDIIKKINSDWFQCFTNKDTAKLKSIFADDIIYVNTRGVVFNKKNILDIVMQPERQYQSIAFEKIIKATVSGNIGMIIAQTITTRKLDNQECAFKSSVMNIFEKRNGKWFVVASHNTILDVR